MFTNLIGIALAFITVMLLLSLVVMAFVQLTQATLRLRGRNLLVGISALIASEEELANNLASPKSKRRMSPKDHTDHAAEILNATTAAKLRPAADPNSFLNVVRGPATSWVDANDLSTAIRARQKVKSVAAPAPVAPSAPDVHAAPAAAAPDAAHVHALAAAAAVAPGGPEAHALAAKLELGLRTQPEDALAAKFRALEPAMTDRFARTMQMWTAVWAIVVAIVFQVSAPTLLQTLSTSQAKRDAILAMVPSIQKQAESTIPAGMSDDFVDRALGQLARDPIVTGNKDATEIQARFDQVSGSTESRGEMIADLRGVLAGVDDRDAIVRRYGEIIDTTATHDVGAAITTAATSADALSMIDIRPWGAGSDFYQRPANLFGVLITAILLSFGAPFWFDQLKNVASLRDALSTPKAADKKA